MDKLNTPNQGNGSSKEQSVVSKQNTTNIFDTEDQLIDSGKSFYQRVEEFAMWQNDESFKQMEYEERRKNKESMKGTIKTDPRLIISNRLYVPIFIIIGISIIVLLLSSLKGVGDGSVMKDEQRAFQITGGVLLAFGIVSLMLLAAYSYHREDKVRARCGYPSLFESSLNGDLSRKGMEETMMIKNTFVDRKRYNAQRLSRLNSVESRSSYNNLGQSFSSTSTASFWVDKHRKFTEPLLNTSLRRENSDTALDKIYARNRMFRFQKALTESKDSSCQDNGVNDYSHVHCSVTKENSSIPCPVDSVISMASSGYCSTVSTHTITKTDYQDKKQCSKKKLSRHLSEPCRNENREIIIPVACQIVKDNEQFVSKFKKENETMHLNEIINNNEIPLIQIYSEEL